MVVEDVDGVLSVQLGKLFADVLEDNLVGLLDGHVGDSTDGELAANLGRDNGLGTRGGESTLDTVERKRWVSPASHQGRLLGVVDSGFATQRFVEVGHGESNVIVERILFLGERSDLVHDARDLDHTLAVNKGSHNVDEVSHGLVSLTTEDTTVKIGSRASDLNRVVVAATETVGQARLLSAEPVVVRDTDSLSILEVLVTLSLDEVLKTLGAVLLHTLEAHEQVNGEINAGLLVSLNGVQPTKDGSLVVGSTTAKHAALVIDSEVEGLSGPTITLLGRLDVVVSIDENSALVLVVTVAGEDDGREVEVLLVRLLAKRAELDLSTERLQLAAEPLTHADDIGAASVLGRDGGNGNSLAQALNEGVGRCVNLVEETVECGSHLLRLVLANSFCKVESTGRAVPDEGRLGQRERKRPRRKRFTTACNGLQ